MFILSCFFCLKFFKCFAAGKSMLKFLDSVPERNEELVNLGQN